MIILLTHHHKGDKSKDDKSYQKKDNKSKSNRSGKSKTDGTRRRCSAA